MKLTRAQWEKIKAIVDAEYGRFEACSGNALIDNAVSRILGRTLAEIRDGIGVESDMPAHHHSNIEITTSGYTGSFESLEMQ